MKDKKCSPSQLKTWIDNEKNYIKWYIKGEARPTSKYMQFGSFIHKAIEEGKSDNPVLDWIVGSVPRLDVAEQSVEIATRIDKEVIILNGILDSYSQSGDELIDYKTGKAGTWSDEVVGKDVQFKFYALMHKLLTKRMLKKVTVVHLHTTENENGDVILTGDYDVFTHTPTKSDLDDVKKHLSNFIKWTKTVTEEKINSDVNKELSEVVLKMRAIKAQQDALEMEYDNLKAIVLADMEKTGQLEIKTDNAHLFFTTRKTYEYPEEVKTLEAGYKKAKTEWEETHEPKTITKSLTFKLK